MTLAITARVSTYSGSTLSRAQHTVKSNNAEDEHKRENKDDDRIDLKAGRLIGVQPYIDISKPSLLSFAHNGKDCSILSIVLVEPPAPAARVLLGRAFAIFSF